MRRAGMRRAGMRRAGASPNTSHLRTSHKKFRSERIKQIDKIEKLILRIKRFRRRQVALLGFVFGVDLLDLPTVDTEPTHWQEVLCNFVSQARQQPLGRLLALAGESERARL